MDRKNELIPGYNEVPKSIQLEDAYKTVLNIDTRIQPKVFLKLINMDGDFGIVYKITGKIVRAGSDNTVTDETVLSAGDTVLETLESKYSMLVLAAKSETEGETPILKIEMNQRAVT